MLFGDRDAFLDKYKTCARTRQYDQQILGSDFYMPKHTKPQNQKQQQNYVSAKPLLISLSHGDLQSSGNFDHPMINTTYLSESQPC